MMVQSDEELQIQANYQLIEELAREKSNLQSIFNTIPIGMLILDSDRCVVRANPTMATYLAQQGFRSPSHDGAVTSDDLIGQRLESTLLGLHVCRSGGLPDPREDLRLWDVVGSVLESGEAEERLETFMLCVHPPNHVEQRWFSVSVAPMRDWQMGYGLLTFLDITDRKRAEEELKAGQDQLRSITNTAQDAVVMVNARGCINFWNPAAEKIFGYTPEEALDRLLHELIMPAEMHEKARLSFANFVTTGRSGAPAGVFRELNAVHKDGHEFPIELSIGGIWRHGSWEAVGVVRDITVRKQAESERAQYVSALESANETLGTLKREAEAATRAKSEFLANVSHEVRTPITAIMGFADLLSDTEGRSAKDVEWAQRIVRSADHLRQILDDVLDLSKIEAGRLQIRRECCDVEAIVDEVATMYRHDANARRLAFVVQHDAGDSKLVMGDETRIRQILANLVSNALKFTLRGTVTIRVDIGSGDEHRANEVRVTVTDTGIGMTASQLGDLFQPFTRVHQTDLNIGGTGLGLAVSIRLAQLIGGRIDVESEPGHGSSFTLSLPAAEVVPLEDSVLPAREASSPRASVSLSGLRILLAEDNADSRELFTYMLEPTGVNLVVVADGAAAVDVATRDSAERFDVVLMDMQMPIMTGFEATYELRKAGVACPIIALTAYAMAHQRELCLEAGCDTCVPKPIVREDLFAAIAEAAGRTQSTQSPSDRPVVEEVDDFAALVVKYVDSLRRHLRTIRAASCAKDLDELCAVTHKLKGTASSYGFPEITRLAGKCHDQLVNGAVQQEVEAPLQELQERIRDVLDEHLPRKTERRQSRLYEEPGRWETLGHADSI